MTFEMMVLILAGKSEKVARAVEKELAPFVVGTVKNKSK